MKFFSDEDPVVDDWPVVEEAEVVVVATVEVVVVEGKEVGVCSQWI